MVHPTLASEATLNEYAEALNQPEWRMKRKEILKRDGYKCRNCGSPNELNIHHRQYHYDIKTGKMIDPWKYQDNLLICVCRECHMKGHAMYKVPVFNINL